jgi:hypothetical protein
VRRHVGRVVEVADDVVMVRPGNADYLAQTCETVGTVPSLARASTRLRYARESAAILSRGTRTQRPAIKLARDAYLPAPPGASIWSSQTPRP